MHRLPRLRLARLLLLVPALGLLGASCAPVDVRFGAPRFDGTLPVEVVLQAGQTPEGTRILLDGEDLTWRFSASANGLVGDVPLPPPGRSNFEVRGALPRAGGGLAIPFSQSVPLLSPASAPVLVGFDPAPSAGAIPRTAWMRLRFASPPSAAALDGPGFAVACDEAIQSRRAYRTEDAVLLDPELDLPAGASCRIAFRGASGAIEEIAFTTAAPAPGLEVVHDREDPTLVAPFPDDYFAVEDASTRTGRRLAIDTPPYQGAVLDAYRGLLAPANRLDGFSRVSPIVVETRAALDPSLLPTDEAESQDPFAPLALFDLDPTSPEYGRRVPYLARLRRDVNRLGQVDHSILVFPSIALRAKGRYALVVTRRLFAGGDPGSTLEGSSFFARVLEPAQAGDGDALTRARTSILPVLDFIETVPEVPIRRSDVALAVRLSIRSDDEIPNDLLAIKERTLSEPPPPLTITNTTTDSRGRTVFRGTVRLTSYLDPVFQRFVRDLATGHPVPQGTEDVPFVLRIPPPETPGPVPIVMYQHGNPGSPEEIVRNDLNGYHLEDGYAVAGIRDYTNRRLGDVDAQIGATFFFLLQTHDIPKFWNQTGADMIGFLRALQGLGGTAWRPAGAAQAPLLDPSRLLYHGISEGGNNALRFLPFAPEILAATPTVGGGRLVEILLHQFPSLVASLEDFLPGARGVQTLVGLSLFQHAYDDQDPHSFAHRLYREPLEIAGLPFARPPSVLWTEGIGDTFVPNNATRSAARELGIPSVRTLRRSSPVLVEVDAPLSANLAVDRTGGHFQFDPATTPGCNANTEGHFCPQTAGVAQQQRRHFLRTALDGPAPEIIDPVP
ncbi:hypothetical protein MYXO_01591 [Myxococcaceae bacterium]|nr:hypothetical protein MYXO_01591 [Myxococcaceae bacterium]